MRLRVLFMYGVYLSFFSVEMWCAVLNKHGLLAVISSNLRKDLKSCNLPPRIRVTLTRVSNHTDAHGWSNITVALSRNSEMRTNAPMYNIADDNTLQETAITTTKNGVFLHDDTQYIVRPRPHTAVKSAIVSMGGAPPGDVPVFVSAVALVTGDSHGYIYSEKSRLLNQRPRTDVTDGINRRHRRHSQMSLSLFHIDVLVVVDYRVFQKWLSTAAGATLLEKQKTAKSAIKEYYALVMAGVDLRYRNIGFGEFNVRIQIAGYVINDNPKLYNWTRAGHNDTSSRDQIDADQALKDFRQWINTTSGLPEHDHAILFTECVSS